MTSIMVINKLQAPVHVYFYLRYLPRICRMKTEAIKVNEPTRTMTGSTLIPGESSVYILSIPPGETGGRLDAFAADAFCAIFLRRIAAAVSGVSACVSLQVP